METKTDILKELAEISPVVARMEKVNVFKVPYGYFDSISETVMACLGEENISLHSTGRFSSTDVPAGYFDNLAGSILDKIKAGQSASEEISNLSPLLSGLQNKQVFETPAGYFENLNNRIIDKINADQSEEATSELSPLLQSLKSRQVFEVPEGYFNGLADTIVKKVHAPSAKIVVMRKRSSFIIKYAAAAMMTGVLALGLYKYLDKPAAVIGVESSAVASLDTTIEKGKNMSEQQFNETLASLNQTDIAKYLEKNGDITDVALLGNNVEESKLPNPEEYLLDEATLDNYLKELEKTTNNN
jgi:hypothetical protein